MLVKKGSLLAKIDDRNYRGLLNQAIADRDLALANVKLDEAEVRRSRTLAQEGCVSQDELDQAENKLAVARASLERAKAAIYSAQYFIDQCMITSPINGIVLKKYHEIGDNINYGGQTEAGAGVFDIAQLADTEDMRAEVDINESDISRIAMGTPASVIPDSYPGPVLRRAGGEDLSRRRSPEGHSEGRGASAQARLERHQARAERQGDLPRGAAQAADQSTGGGAEEGRRRRGQGHRGLDASRMIA